MHLFCFPAKIRIAVGAVGAANVNVTQIVEVFGRDNEKFEWLVNTIPRLVKEGSIVYVSLEETKRKRAEHVKDWLYTSNCPVELSLTPLPLPLLSLV